MSEYICDRCGKSFTQKCHYDNHINKKYPCVTIEQLKNENNILNSNKTDIMELSNVGFISTKEALKDTVHDIHNFMRNNGGGYGMGALKVFNVLYSLYKLEEEKLLEQCGIDIKFTELREYADKPDGGAFIKPKIDAYVDILYNNKDLRRFLYHEVSNNISEPQWTFFIKKMDIVKSLENTGEQLCGKIYEYFIGRDKSAIEELGAYFTNRHIVNFIYQDLLTDVIKLEVDGSIPSMIDMFGGSGGFTVGYIDFIKNKLKLEVNWKENINKVYHFDMNEDVIKSAAFELFCLTQELPKMCTSRHEDGGNIGYRNSFTFDFDNMKFKLIVTNPPYGGDKHTTSELTDKSKKLLEHIEKLEKDETDQKIIEKYREQKKQLNFELKEKRKIEQESKVNLDSSGGRIKKYAKKHKLKGNDKESCSLILLMDMVEEGGTVCGVLKEGVFFDKKYKDLRKHLVENFNVTKIISVDNTQFENTGTKTSIVVFHNTGKTENVEFYDLIMETYETDKYEIDSEFNVRLIENKGDVKGVHKEFVASTTIDVILENEKVSLSGKEYDTIITTPNDGYKIVKLGDISEIQNGNAFKTTEFVKEGIPVLKIKDVNNDNIDIKTINDYIEENEKYKNFLIKNNSIILSLTGKVPNLGSIAIFKYLEKVYLNQRVCEINFLEGDNMYLYSVLKQISIPILNISNTGSIQNNITLSQLKNLEIPIPESDEKIQEWTEKISKPYNDYIDKTKEYEQLESQIQIDIQQMIHTNPCDKIKLGDICKINFGKRITKKNDSVDKNDINAYPVYGGGDITFYTDKYNRENKTLVISRFALSERCVRIVKGKFFLNDSGLSLKFNNYQDYYSYYLYLQQDFIKNKLTEGSIQSNIDINKLKNLLIDIPKDKSLIDNLQPTFDKIELLQKESTEAKELYENLLVELKKDAIKEIKNTKGVIYPEPLVSNNDEPKSQQNKESSKKKPDSNEVLSDEELTSQQAISDSLNASSDDEVTDSDTDEDDLYTEADLNLMTVPNIKQALTDKNITFRSRDKKAELIQKYLDAV